jgi:UDP-glucuronate 4-epimerase
MRVLVTGAAGFIGYHVSERLLRRGDEVWGVDNLNAYYDPELKRARLARLLPCPGFTFVEDDISDRDAMAGIFARAACPRVIHLAAQAGVRHSLTQPYAYIDANLGGFITVLEGCRRHGVEHLVYASSSSVYGLNGAVPASVDDPVGHPASLYAATKAANELMAHSYSHLFGLPATGLRFFTVYGPWGRPDMALFSFTRAILAGEPIPVFNHGRMRRDFTYIDDIATGVVQALDRPAAPDPAWDGCAPAPGSSRAPWRIYNLGGGDPVELERFIAAIEAATGRSAIRDYQPLQPGDVPATAADQTAWRRDFGPASRIAIEEGVARFVAWYRAYHRV